MSYFVLSKTYQRQSTVSANNARNNEEFRTAHFVLSCDRSNAQWSIWSEPVYFKVLWFLYRYFASLASTEGNVVSIALSFFPREKPWRGRITRTAPISVELRFHFAEIAEQEVWGCIGRVRAQSRRLSSGRWCELRYAMPIATWFPFVYRRARNQFHLFSLCNSFSNSAIPFTVTRPPIRILGSNLIQ